METVEFSALASVHAACLGAIYDLRQEDANYHHEKSITFALEAMVMAHKSEVESLHTRIKALEVENRDLQRHIDHHSSQCLKAFKNG